MRKILVVCAAVLACALLHAQDKTTLRYTPEPGQKWVEKLTGELLDVAMQGQSLGIRGGVEAKSAVEVAAVNLEKKLTTVRFTLSEVAAALNGEATKPAAPAPVELLIDPTGAMSMAKDNNPDFAVNFLDTGGLPLQVISVLAHTIRFSQDPVAVGDEWTNKDKYVFPGMGEVPVNTQWKLLELKDGKASVQSSAMAILPNFKAPNPLAPGTDMNVLGAKVYLTEMTQKYDVAKSRLLSTDGKLKIDAKIDMQGLQMPIVMAMKFNLTPPKPEPPR